MLESSNISFALHQLKENNIMELLRSFMQVFGVVPMYLSYISLALHRHRIHQLLVELQNIFDKCEWKRFVFEIINFLFRFFIDRHTSAAHSYLKTNDLCEKFMIWSLIVQEVSYLGPSIILLVFGIIVHYVQDGHVEMKDLYMPLITW